MDQVITIQAEAALEILASCKVVWERVINLSERPTLKSWSPISGTWPAETATVRVVMNKGVEIMRTDTVVRMIPHRRLLLKVDAPDFNTVSWVDHCLTDTKAGCELSISVIVDARMPEDQAMDRAAYAASTEDALQKVLIQLRDEIAGPGASGEPTVVPTNRA